MDLIIIGGGTAGLTAAIYAARSGISVTVIERAVCGGQVLATSGIDNYPGMPGVSGGGFAFALYNQVKDLGVNILYETITSTSLTNSKKIITTSKNSYKTKAVIIATGAKPKKLGVPGEEKWIGQGVAFCATCDGALYKGKNVAVIGGGNVATQDAVLLSGLCHTVTVIHRSNNFSAEGVQLSQAKSKENIKFLTNFEVKEIIGDSTLNKLILESKLNGQSVEIPVDGVFIAIGAEPDNSVFASEIILDKKGYIVAGEDCKTNLPGVFVAGDTRTKNIRQIVTAAADGCVAALSAYSYINNPKEG